MSSVTQQLAEWIVATRYDDLPDISVSRVGERFIDSLGVQFAGMSVQTGQMITAWARAQGCAPVSPVVGRDFRTTAALGRFGQRHSRPCAGIRRHRHVQWPLREPVDCGDLGSGGESRLVGQRRRAGLDGRLGGHPPDRDPCMDGPRNTLLWRGWFNQGFQPTLGVAALTAKLMGLNVTQTRRALANAASSMGGVLKNRGSDTKSFRRAMPPCTGSWPPSWPRLGFTGNEDILDGDDGVIRMMGLEVGDPQKVLNGLGEWDMAVRGSTLRLHASCRSRLGSRRHAAHRAAASRHPDEIESITVYLPAFLMDMMPYHQPQTGCRPSTASNMTLSRSRSTEARACRSTPMRLCNGPRLRT